MNKKFIISIALVVLCVLVLVYSASTSNAKAVVTVHELLTDKKKRASIRLGARVADAAIIKIAEPKQGVEFFVRDITGSEEDRIKVVYYEVMPDTLKVGRDVILEGNFEAEVFEAKNLVTQCPSKYVPPTPGAESNRTEETKPY